MERKEAIEVIKKNWPDSSFTMLREALETVIPELKESEDERTWIINYLSNRKLNSSIIAEKENLKKAIAWLEKQGEQKPVDKVEPKFKAGDKVISTLTNNPYYITEVCNGHYQTDMGCIIMFNAQDNFELVEQKPAWSEEDDAFFKAIIRDIENIKYIIEDAKKDRINWLKSLKERVQPQQEWSEEDNINCNRLLYLLNGGNLMHDHKVELFIWVESLKARCTWKPSDEQMEAIQDAIEFLGCTKKVREDLKSLYEQLKKLREE